MQAASAEEEIKYSKKVIRLLANDPEKSATLAHLIYVNDKQPGIKRGKKRKTFCYYFNDKKISDNEVLARIRSLVIPPAWKNVWICTKENGHIQVTGIDARGRKQYMYHPLWNSLRGQTKFYRLNELGKILPALRAHLNKDLREEGLPRNKVLAAIVSIMEQTTIRIGNSFYEKIYGSFGLSTFKNKHAKIEGNKIRFLFKGKKGIAHDISMHSKKLAAIVQRCKHIPGQELFQYKDEEGNIHNIDSGDVNEYIKEIAGHDFTSKDFRTWAGSVECIKALKEMSEADSETGIKKNIVAALDKVAHHLGNTRSVCKKHYVHPAVLEYYESGKLEKLIKDIGNVPDEWKGLDENEIMLMRLLEK